MGAIRLERCAENARYTRAASSESAAKQHELAEHRSEGFVVEATEISDGLEIGLQVPQQPDDFEVSIGLGFQPAAGADAVQVTIYIELEQVLRIIARPAG
jgi:hypothetical protein